MKTETKIKKYQDEIDSYEDMLTDKSIPADEKAIAREEIADLKKKIEKLKKAGKKPGHAPHKGKEAAPKKGKKEVDEMLKKCKETIAAARGPRKAPVQHQAATRLSDAVEKVWNIIESEVKDDADALKKGKALCTDFEKEVQKLIGAKTAVNKDIQKKAADAITDASAK